MYYQNNYAQQPPPYPYGPPVQPNGYYVHPAYAGYVQPQTKAKAKKTKPLYVRYWKLWIVLVVVAVGSLRISTVWGQAPVAAAATKTSNAPTAVAATQVATTVTTQPAPAPSSTALTPAEQAKVNDRLAKLNIPPATTTPPTTAAPAPAPAAVTTQRHGASGSW